MMAQSVETFYGIRLEDETTNNAIELRPPSLTQSYTLTFPASRPTLLPGQSRTLSINGDSAGLAWGTVPLLTGTTPGVAYFKTNDEVSSSTDFTWNDATRTLTLNNATTGSALITASKAGAPGTDVFVMTLTNASLNPGTTANKRTLQINSTGAWTGNNIGMEVVVGGGTNNYAATFSGGNVGIGTTTPVATVEINGDMSYTEFNYTTTLPTSSNNMDFTGNGNKATLIRIGGTQTAPFTFTGFAGGVAGKTFTILNASTQPMTISNQNAGSNVTNRFITPGNDAIVIPSQSTVTVHYSGIDQRWYVGAVSPLNFTGYPLTEANVSGTNTVLPTATASYIKVTNNDFNKDVTLENGVATGQVLIIQNNGTSTYSIRITGGNVEIASSDSTIQPGQAIFMVWDGAKWQTVSAKS
jgi:hypothetical protein